MNTANGPSLALRVSLIIEASEADEFAVLEADSRAVSGGEFGAAFDEEDLGVPASVGAAPAATRVQPVYRL